MNNNTNTFSVVGRAKSKDVRIYSDEKSDIEKSDIVKIGMTRQFISSGNISSSKEMIMPAGYRNSCRTEGHENIDHGVDGNDMGEETTSNKKRGFSSREKQSKK